MHQTRTDKAKDLLDRILNSSGLGLFHAVNATIFLVLGHFAGQVTILTAPGMPKLEVVFIRSCEQLVLLIPFVLLFEAKVFHSREHLPAIAIISATGCFCYVALYLLLDIIPLSTALAISGTNPFFASIFSYFILKEKINCVETSCGLVGLVGVLFIARPSFIFGNMSPEPQFTTNKSPKQLELLHLVGCGMAMLDGASRALYLVYVRKWSRVLTDTKGIRIVSVMYPTILTILLTPMMMIFLNDGMKLPAEMYGKTSLFAVGIFTFLGLISLNMATKTQNATVIGVIRNLEIVWAFILQYFVFGYVPSWWNLGGSLLIVGTTIVASLSSKLDCFERS